jgi:hypothetical protein
MTCQRLTKEADVSGYSQAQSDTPLQAEYLSAAKALIINA